MNRIRLPLAALALSLLAACQSSAPTAPVDPREPSPRTLFGTDTTTTLAREGTLIGSGN
jgi:hypothetical protein